MGAYYVIVDSGIGCLGISDTGYSPEFLNSVRASRFNIDLYPNPATSFLHIRCNEKITTVTVLNIFGQTVAVYDCDTPTPTIDVGKLPEGCYIVKINGSAAGRFFKEVAVISPI